MNFIILGVFRKMNIFLWYEDSVDIGGGGGGGVPSQKLTGFRGHFYAFQGLFLRSMYRMGIFYGVAKKFKYFIGYA